MRIKDILVEFNNTGDCKVDVDKLVDGFTNLFYIIQWYEQYTLIQSNVRGATTGRVQISEEQARQIINRLSLESTCSLLFNNSKKWVFNK